MGDYYPSLTAHGNGVGGQWLGLVGVSRRAGRLGAGDECIQFL